MALSTRTIKLFQGKRLTKNLLLKKQSAKKNLNQCGSDEVLAKKKIRVGIASNLEFAF